MSSLPERLLLVEEDFLHSLTEGDEALIAFERRWEALLDDVNAALDSSTLDSSTSNLAHTTAIRIATLAEISTELSEACDMFTTQLFGQLNTMMSNLSLSESQSERDGIPLSPTKILPLHNPKESRSSSSTSRKRRCRSPEELTSSLAKRRRSRSPLRTYQIHSGAADVISAAPVTWSSPCTSEATTRSRKRRLSDADGTLPLHRPKRLHVGPRLHAVSDSYIHVADTHTSPQPGWMVARHSHPPELPVSSAAELAPELETPSGLGIHELGISHVQADAPESGQGLFIQPFDVGQVHGLWDGPSDAGLLLPELMDLQDLFGSLLDAPICVAAPTDSGTISGSGIEAFSDTDDSVSSSTASSPSPITPRSTPSSISGSPYDNESTASEFWDNGLSLTTTVDPVSFPDQFKVTATGFGAAPLGEGFDSKALQVVDWTAYSPSLWDSIPPPPYTVDLNACGGEESLHHATSPPFPVLPAKPLINVAIDTINVFAS